MTVRGHEKPYYIFPFNHRGSLDLGMFGGTGALIVEQTAPITAVKRAICGGSLLNRSRQDMPDDLLHQIEYQMKRLMSKQLPFIYLARHGETSWSLTGQHTGLTDLPLTDRGERSARALGARLAGLHFTKVFTSPLLRARRTCELAGFGSAAEVDHDLLEWNYGQYEGRRTEEIHAQRPDWQLFRDGCPGGETPDQVGERADRALSRVRAAQANVLLFSSGHFLRVLAARWLVLKPAVGRYLELSTASLSALGYEHDMGQPVIKLWNDIRHVVY